jgi:hypothetical protein
MKDNEPLEHLKMYNSFSHAVTVVCLLPGGLEKVRPFDFRVLFRKCTLLGIDNVQLCTLVTKGFYTNDHLVCWIKATIRERFSLPVKQTNNETRFKQ